METNELGGFIMELGFWIAFKIALGFSIGYGIGKAVLVVCKRIFITICNILIKLGDDKGISNLTTGIKCVNSERDTSIKSKCRIGFH